LFARVTGEETNDDTQDETFDMSAVWREV